MVCFNKCVLSSSNRWKALRVGAPEQNDMLLRQFMNVVYIHKTKFLGRFFNKYELFFPSQELVNLWQNSSLVRLNSKQLFCIWKQKNMKWLVATFSDTHLFLNFIIVTVQLKNSSGYIQLHKAHGAPPKDVHKPDSEGPVPISQRRNSPLPRRGMHHSPLSPFLHHYNLYLVTHASTWSMSEGAVEGCLRTGEFWSGIRTCMASFAKKQVSEYQASILINADFFWQWRQSPLEPLENLCQCEIFNFFFSHLVDNYQYGALCKMKNLNCSEVSEIPGLNFSTGECPIIEKEPIPCVSAP